jgi:hypothetical protein
MLGLAAGPDPPILGEPAMPESLLWGLIHPRESEREMEDPMQSRVTAPLFVLALIATAYAAKKPSARDWKQGILRETAFTTQDLGTAGHVMVFGGVYGPPMATTTARRVVRTWEGFRVEAGDTQYMFACPVSHRRMPNVTVNGPIAYAIDTKGNYFLRDDSGNDCQAALLEKRILSASPVGTLTARMYDPDGRIADLSFTWDGSGHGKLSGKLPTGEMLSGEYSTIVAADSQHGKATLVGDKGSLIECEYAVSPANHGFGECRDQNGKSYRFQF